MDGENRTYRAGELAIAWQVGGLIGRLTLDGEHWASVEWSEKRQRWCVEDVEGQCLKHVASIRGQAASKAEAVALAEAMVRDGRMPSPAQARVEHQERQRAKLAKKRAALAAEMTARDGRTPTPREVLDEVAARRRAEEQKRREEREAETERMRLASEIEWDERSAQPLYETLDEAFNLADPDLWKSNSFAALKPRLVLHVEAAIATLHHHVASVNRRASVNRPGLRDGFHLKNEAKLERAQAIYRKLTGAEWTPRPSRMSQTIAEIAALTAKQEAEAAAVSGAEEKADG